MRNLKKILALVLALVMSLSLMATAGAGSFQDVTDDNPYKTAIDVLDELKVFQGFEDGSFKPTDTLNRAQAAVLVYRIATGDVEGKQVDNYTYMAQSKFTDLDGYNWAKGYINYCQNAGIVVGTDATHFNPGGKVTGYQLLVMLLRTLGYGKAGEFADPKGWELQTASIAEREGITKYITSGDFGAAAPRQMVAEILFRGLLTETVTYSALTSGGYTKSGETLGKRELGLEDVKGVVMANEFADLEDDDTLAADKTRLVDADGKVYNLDVSSELTDVGEIRHAYVQNGTKVLTTLEDLNDSTVNQPENGKGTKVKDLSKTNGDTQYFLNFGENDYTWTSDWKIKYVVNLGGGFNVAKLANAAQGRVEARIAAGEELGFALPDAYDEDDTLISGSGYSLVETATAGTYNLVYTQEFKIHEEIGADHQKNIKLIFDIADKTEDEGYITGEVYAGTTSRKDLSDEMTRDDFIKDYIIDSSNKAIDGSDNGEWLKTIDNDGDGVAEYVFLTTFVMSVIDDYNTKTETYYVEYDADSNGTDRKANDSIKKSDIVTEDELNVGDVILYTWIDGKCYVSKPEVDTAAIDKKGINYKAETITCGDTTYEWSGIEQEAYHYYHDVSEAQVEVNYDLYKDHFGYVRLFAEANKGFVLLTDGFYATDLKKEHTYKAEIWDDAAEELAEVDLANNDAGFIDRTIDNSTNREEGTWDRLNGFDVTYRDHVEMNGLTPVNDFITNIAAYDVNSDGAYNLDVINSYTGRYWYGQHELDIDSFDKGSVKDKDLDIADRANGNDTGLDRINATDETLYYYVQYKGTPTNRYNPEVDSVTTWTGYNNGSVKLVDGDRAYAVTRAYQKADNSDWVNYETAEIIVIEHQIVGEKNIIFPTALNQRLIGTRNLIGGTGFAWGGDDGKWILDDFDGKYAAQGSATVTSVTGTNLAPVDISDLLHFYEKQPDGSLLRIDADYNDYDIYAGVIVTEVGTVSRLYGEIGLAYYDVGTTSYVTDPDDLEPEHDFYKSSDNFYTIGYDRAESQKKDEMLHIPGFQYDWLYGNVAATFDANGLDASKMKLGDLVLYVTDGDGVVQSIINVTKSEMSKNYDPNGAAEGKYPGVYEDDPHTVGDNYPSTSTLLTLWEDIAETQTPADPADVDEPTVKFYGEDAGDPVSYKTAADAIAAGDVDKIYIEAKPGNTITLVQVDGVENKDCIASDKKSAAIAAEAAVDTNEIKLIVTVTNGEAQKAFSYTLQVSAQVDNADELELAATDEATWLTVTGSDVDGEPATASVNVQGNRTVAQVIAGLKVVFAGGATSGTPGEVAGTVRYDGANGSDLVNNGDEIEAVVVNEDGTEYPITITVSTAKAYTVKLAKGLKAAGKTADDKQLDGSAIEDTEFNGDDNMTLVVPEGTTLTIALKDATDTADRMVVNGATEETVGDVEITRDTEIKFNDYIKIDAVGVDVTDSAGTKVTAGTTGGKILAGNVTIEKKNDNAAAGNGWFVGAATAPVTDTTVELAGGNYTTGAAVPITMAIKISVTVTGTPTKYTSVTANSVVLYGTGAVDGAATYVKQGTSPDVVIVSTAQDGTVTKTPTGAVASNVTLGGATHTEALTSVAADTVFNLAD